MASKNGFVIPALYLIALIGLLFNDIQGCTADGSNKSGENRLFEF